MSNKEGKEVCDNSKHIHECIYFGEREGRQKERERKSVRERVCVNMNEAV